MFLLIVILLAPFLLAAMAILCLTSFHIWRLTRTPAPMRFRRMEEIGRGWLTSFEY